jgi:hypothetical protein
MGCYPDLYNHLLATLRIVNKWQIICPVVLLGFLGVVGVVMFHRQGVLESRALRSAITQQIDGHASGIAALLATMGTNDTSAIEDEAFAELQRVPSTSLITRPDIRVTRTSDGLLECVIDTSRWGVSSRTIRQSATRNPSL